MLKDTIDSFSNGELYEEHWEACPICTIKEPPEQCYRISNRIKKELQGMSFYITPERHTYKDGSVRFWTHVKKWRSSQIDGEFSTVQDAIESAKSYIMWELNISFSTVTPMLAKEVKMVIMPVKDVPVNEDHPTLTEKTYNADNIEPLYFVYCNGNCALYWTCRRADRISEQELCEE